MSQVEINNLAYPYLTVVYLESTFPNGATYTGSGVMVGPNDVLTASHVVYSGGDGGAATSIRVIVGYDPSPYEAPYGVVYSSLINYYSYFDPNNDGLIASGDGGSGFAGSEVDFALVGLSVAVGDNSGWMGIDPNFSTGYANITGYPGFYSNNPMNDYGYVYEDSIDYIFHYGMEVHPGNSGGPIWYNSNGLPYVIGVVSTGSYGAQLSGANFNTLLAWISGNDYLIANADRHLTGNAAANYYTTGNGNDTIDGAGGDDGIISGGGNDVVNGGDGNDTIYGQAGNDTLRGDAGNDTIFGGNDNDTIMGGTGNDILNGEAGNDTLNGEAGNDTLNGGTGTNTLNGGDGDDILIAYDVGTHTLNGGDGNDSYFASVACTIIDSSGVDTLWAGYNGAIGEGIQIETVHLLGGSTAYYFAGNALANTLYGNELANYLWGLGGDDTIYGGGGNDILYGDTGAGTAGADKILGEGGDDTIFAGGGNDIVVGGDGNDTILGEDGNDALNGEAGNDAIEGGNGDDFIFGMDGNDILFGADGNDQIYGGQGNDVMCGERNDTSAPAGGDDIMYGEAGVDNIFGGAGNDVIYGGDGNDVIAGGRGYDAIFGGPGADTILGSGPSAYGAATPGNDLFIYTSLADRGDQIYGFDTRAGNTDGIDFRVLFDSFGYTGTTPRANGYMTVTGTTVATDCVVWIDPDGGGNSYSIYLTIHDVVPASLTDAYFLFQ